MSFPQITVNTARTRLALTYLAIIMALSIGFSVIFYLQSTSEVSFGLRRQATQLQSNLFFTTPDGIATIRDIELSRFRDNLLAKLILINAGMLVIGGVASYYLALRSLRPLEQALQAQSRFTSDAAHELRTPLTAMKTESEVALRSRKISTAEAKELLRSNLEEIGKLEILTSALLRLARSAEKIDTSHWQDYKLLDILKAAQTRLSDKAGQKNIKIKLPKTTLVVHGDPDQLTELFVTLLGNAVKYSHDDSEVTVAASADSASVRVDIIDKGIGIAEVDMPHIFERFYRADQSRNKTKADGYGLGLSLAEAIVRAHGGEIRVKSIYGKGSIFTVVLPKVRE